jgi:hypothetical protein
MIDKISGLKDFRLHGHPLIFPTPVETTPTRAKKPKINKKG